MIPHGVLFIWVNILYVVFAYVLGTIAYFVAKRYYPNYKNRIALGVFFIILLAPFWDLIIQKGIKTYYETFKMESTIYAYPQRDKDGKIESLGIYENVSHGNSGYLVGIEDFKQLKNAYAVKSFLECYMSDSFTVDKNGTVHYNYRKDLGYARVDLSSENINYEKLKDESEYKARYQIAGTVSKNFLYTKKEIYFKDTKTKTLLAEGFKIIFEPASKNAFRNRFLLWKSANNSPIGIESISNYGEYYRLLTYNRKD